MSVTTTADEKRRQIDEKLSQVNRAIKENLKEIRVLTIEAFDTETWGSNEYGDEVEGNYHNIANDLQELSRKLSKF